jgi:hypothetical chaperone protein
MSTGQISYGIDFGTTNSTVAYANNEGQIIQLPLDPEAENPLVTRSVIYVSPEQRFLFGQAAIDAYLHDIATTKPPSNKTVSTGKHITINDNAGRDQTVPEIIELSPNNSGRLLQSLKTALGNEIVNKINLFGKVYSLEEVVATFLKELKRRADKIVGERVVSAVVGRPVEYAGNSALALERMERACKLAGFKNIRFEYEPIGAAHDHGVSTTDSQKVLIFDFGGGTLDISVLQFPEKKVLVNAGLPIGGDKFNSEIFEKKLASYFGSELVWGEKKLGLPRHIFISLQNWYEISLLKKRSFIDSLEQYRYQCSDPNTLRHLKSLVVNSLGFAMYEEIERVKKTLSSQKKGRYHLKAREIDLTTTISKLEFERMMTEHLSEIRKFMADTLSSIRLEPQDVDIVATTGGSTLIPVVRSLLVEIFGSKKIKQSNVFTGVASGLAMIANQGSTMSQHT